MNAGLSSASSNGSGFAPRARGPPAPIAAPTTISRVLPSPHRVPRQTRSDQAIDGGWRASGKLWPRIAENSGNGGGRRRRLERPKARRHFEQDRAEGEDVRARVYRATFKLFGGHVGCGADELAGRGLKLGDRHVGHPRGIGRYVSLRNPEIKQLDATRGHHDV